MPAVSPPPGGGYHHDVGFQAERVQIVDDLAAGRALAGDDQRVVVGRDQCGAALSRDRLGNRLAVFARAIVKHDLGAERRGAFALGARRIARHDNDARHAEQAEPLLPRLARDFRNEKATTPPARRSSGIAASLL